MCVFYQCFQIVVNIQEFQRGFILHLPLQSAVRHADPVCRNRAPFPFIFVSSLPLPLSHPPRDDLDAPTASDCPSTHVVFALSIREATSETELRLNQPRSLGTALPCCRACSASSLCCALLFFFPFFLLLFLNLVRYFLISFLLLLEFGLHLCFPLGAKCPPVTPATFFFCSLPFLCPIGKYLPFYSFS